MARQKDQSTEAKKLFDQLIRRIPRDELWPVIVGLLQHVLLEDETTLNDYYYGVFAVTDTLRDAAQLQKSKGADMDVPVVLLTLLRTYHLGLNMSGGNE